MNRWKIVTVTYNSAETLRQFWSHRCQDGHEWVVVDNCSQDDSASVAEELGALVVRSKSNVGFSAANNVGYRTGEDADYVAYVNPDVSIEQTDFEALASFLSENDAIVAPQLFNPDGTRQPNGRGDPTIWAKIGNRLSASLDRENSYRLYAGDDEALEVSWVMGAFVGVRSHTMDRIGGWNENFFIYFEDSELCLRGRLAGVPSYVLGSVRAEHGWAREAKSFSWTPIRHELVSGLKFYRSYPKYLLPTVSRI